MRRTILALAMSLWAASASAQDGTTVGTLQLASTFDCIGVTASFTGDANANNSATVEYKTSASETWLAAYTPMVDRRTTISGDANPYVNQFRGSVVGLAAGTTYDVRVTYSDGDGVSGGLTLSSSVTTIASTVPGLTGTDRYATNDSTLATALGAATAGDTIHLAAGTYSPFTLSVSGTAENWIALIGDNRDTTIISGGITDLTVSANYVQIKNLRFQKPSTSGTTQGIVVAISASAHHVWLDNLHFEDLPLPGGGASYGNATVNLGSGVHHVYVLNSLFHAPSLASKPDKDYDVGGFGVQMSTLAADGTIVVKGNTFDGKFQDAIGGTPESFGYSQWNNSDVANNTISGYSDDGIQTEGDTVNVRIWGNTVTASVGWSCLAQQTAFAGPVYVFRNVLIGTGSDQSIFKSNGASYVFAFHNTADASSTTDNVISGTTVNWVARNNIWLGSNYSILYGPGSLATGSFDYDLYYPNTNVCSAYPSSLADWKAAVSGQEVNAPAPALPGFLNAAKQIDAASPAYNVGVTLANFNTATSAWPSIGAGPDLGYFEVGSGSAPTAPTNVRIR